MAELKVITKPENFFREMVTQALGQTRVRVQPETEYYLVNLLSHFMNTDNLYSRDGEGQLDARPLALQIKDAIEEARSHNRMLLFRQVGDFSLYTAGYFGDSLNHKAVDVDYYIDMGGVAYGQVASHSSESHLRDMYAELAEKFQACVEVLSRIAEQTQPRSEKDLLRLYEKWQATGSESAARSLEEAGIIPVQNEKKKSSS